MTPSAWQSLKQLTFSLYTTNTTHIVIIERGSELVDKGCMSQCCLHQYVISHRKRYQIADISLQNYSDSLGVAAHNGHTETVQRLLEAGATVNYQNKVMTNTVLCVYCPVTV